jgi:O-antigen ligase
MANAIGGVPSAGMIGPRGAGSRAGAMGMASKSQSGRTFDFLVAALLPIYVWRIQDVFPILAKIQAPSLVSLAALAVFIMGGHAALAMPRYRTRVITLATFMLVWMVASVPTSVYPGLSFGFITSDHIKTFIMTLMLIASIRGVWDAERLVLTNMLGALVYCTKIITTYSVGSDGRLNAQLYYDANDISMMVVCTLPIAVYFLRSQAKPIHRLIAAGSSAIFVLTIVRAGSRGGFLGLIAVGLYLVFGYRAIPVRARFGSVALVAVLMVVLAGPQFWSLMATTFNPKDDYNVDAEEGRVEVWKRGMGYVKARPITGVGVNAYTVAEGTISAISGRQDEGIGVRWGTAHNSFVQIAAELGVPGFIAFVLFIGTMLKTGWNLSRAGADAAVSERDRALAGALVASLIGYAVAGFFLSQAYSAYLYATCGILTGLAASTQSTRALQLRQRPPVRGGRRVARRMA